MFFFFFQAEDGIRDVAVTGVQTCALPISHREVAASPAAVARCRKVEEALKFLCTSIQGRLDEFKAGFESFWGGMSRKSFERLRRQVEGNHAGMGATLCGVTVKMRDWSRKFPDDNAGSASERLKYVMEQMEPGLEKLKQAENDARLLAASF